ncbi:Yip1 family protein [Pleionea litopenaei]|uniref:Yip1 family protein n=1 Tax=Pleionea litopenaei TaxID=3070815 RepID=A0AA51RRD6_9GAMM|nr:Yip1 family protein [Pleionea sp. HL-JVS1]WMS86226.1 Yip1 family protein [Pleionea sp. HL-JVS1]
MSLRNTFGLLYEPEKQWQKISEKNDSVFKTYFKYIVVMALLPPAAAYVGSTHVGWTLGMSDTYRLTPQSALQLSVAAYLAILVAVLVLAWFVQWMAKTYGANPSYKRCVNLTAYSCTPLFLVSILGVYPILWLDMLFSLVAIGWAVYLLYNGVPIMMGIDRDRGFLFASSIITVCMCVLVGMLAITVIFWGWGLAPVFTH